MVSRIPRFPSVFFIAALAWADLTGPFVAPLEHPAIEYSARASTDPIAALNQRIQDGQVELKFDGASVTCAPLLDALHIPVESQMLVFSKTSFKRPASILETPAASSSTTRWWWDGFAGGDILEIAAEDPRQGVMFTCSIISPGRNFNSNGPNPTDPNSNVMTSVCDATNLTAPWEFRAWSCSAFTPTRAAPRCFAAGTFVTDHRRPAPTALGRLVCPAARAAPRGISATRL